MKTPVFVIVLGTFLAMSATAQQASSITDSKQLWQLLDYVAVDYSGAVEKGVVISEGEYAEMLDFTDTATRQAQGLPDHPSKETIAKTIDDLRAAVVRKAESTEVARLAHQANDLLIAAYPIPVAPKALPDLVRGSALYSAQCSACHGGSGDGNGPQAARLDPRPIAFTDAARASSRSLLALYQVITQGVEGTSMASFEALPEEDRWSLAFFIGGMSYDDAMRRRGLHLWETDASVKALFPDISAITTLTQSVVAEKLPSDTAHDVTAFLRAHPEVVDAEKPSGLALARLRLKESLAALRTDDRAGALRLGLSAYLDGFEPIEPAVQARDGKLLIAVEEAMMSYRAAITKGTREEAEAAARQLDNLFTQVDSKVLGVKANSTATFLGALTILLREGLEAILIVVGMIALLKKAERRDVLSYVHGGWVAALVAGGITWAVATYLVTISGASREITEGLGSVLAAFVLLSVGLWMHQKSSAGRWQAYLVEKLSGAMSRGSSWGLFALSFVAVYREVFETVLFYSALAADGNSTALLAGFLSASLLLALIAWTLLRTSARMPIGKFFSVTSILVAVLAVVLIGKGFAGLQEAGWIGATPMSAPRIDILGIFPTVETILAQILVLAIALTGFGFNTVKARGRQGA